MWVWLVTGGGLILVWSVYKSRTSGKQQDTTAAADSTSAADVPQIVNQTYTTVQAPSVQEEPEPSEPARPGVPPPKPPFRVFPPVVKPTSRRPGIPVAHQPPIFNAVYIVRKGETLNSVAAKFRITRVELAHANGLGTGAGLRTGQKLRVPQPAGTGSPNRAA